MSIFDIVGPVMVGPSSSHTAGVRIGYICYKLMDEPIRKVEIGLYGSFLATGKGHGTDKALVAGLLGMKPDDIRVLQSFELAKETGMEFSFYEAKLAHANPNTVALHMTGESGRELDIVAESVGGGRIRICKIDGLDANFSGDYPTLIVHNLDQPGHVTEVTSMLGHKSINIATMQLYRACPGGHAVMVLECDQEVPKESLKWLEHLEGILKVTYLSLKDD
jgi:L-serine dehydratase